MPAHEVVEAESFEHQFDTTFATDFEQRRLNAGEGCCHHRIDGRIHLQVGHSGTVAQQVHGLVEHVLRQFAQFGLGLGIGQQYFGIADDGKIDANVIAFFLVVDEALDLMISGEILVERLHVDTGTRGVGHGVDQLPARISQRLINARVTVLELFDELPGLVTGLRRIVRAVFHQVSLYQIFGRTGDVITEHISPETILGHVVLVVTGLYHFGIGRQVGTIEQCIIVLVRFSGIINPETALLHDFRSGIGRNTQISVGRSLQVQFVVILAVGAFVQGMAGHGSQYNPLVDGT